MEKTLQEQNQKAPKANIYSLQVLNQSGIGDVDKILISLRWCIEEGIDVINLSLGSLSSAYVDEFVKIGLRAREKGILVFVSLNEDGFESIPSSLEGYIGVGSALVKGKYSYKWDAQAEKAYAFGGSQRVGWPSDPYYMFMDGNSFATAHMSAIAVLIKQACPAQSYDFYLKMLKKHAISLIDKKIKPITSELEWSRYNAEPFVIKDAVIYAYTKEMHALIRYADLTNINIVGICDHVRSGRVGQIVDFKGKQLTVLPQTKLPDLLNSADTLIISRTNKLGEMLREDMLLPVIRTAVEKKRNIYTLEYSEYAMFPELYQKAKENGCLIRHPAIGAHELGRAKQIRTLFGHITDSVPILGVFGTGTSQGKFSLQLLLRKLFLDHQYNVCNLGTEMHSELFGFESYYPLEILKSIRFSQWEMMEFLQGEVRRLELSSPKPDIIIAGSQSGTIPKNYLINSPIQTLPSLAFLMGTVPHAYILVVNINDDVQYIMDTISALQVIGKGKVLAIAFLRQKKTAKGLQH